MKEVYAANGERWNKRFSNMVHLVSWLLDNIDNGPSRVLWLSPKGNMVITMQKVEEYNRERDQSERTD